MTIPRENIEIIVCADIHLTLTPPLCRSGERNWLERQAFYLKQLYDLSNGTSQKDWNSRPIPVVCCGDIFNVPQPPIELVNFALKHLPHMYAVPGNHDLPNHRYEDMHKSAYQTLVAAGKVTDISPTRPTYTAYGAVCLYGFPYGVKNDFGVFPKNSMVLDIAIVHEYVWAKGTGYHGAPESHSLAAFRKRMGKGFDFIFTGDNHTPFTATNKSPKVINCGSLMRRTVTEMNHKPRLWALMRDQTVKPVHLDVADDVIEDTRDTLVKMAWDQDARGMTEFIKELRNDRVARLSFAESITRYMRDNNTPKRIKNIILEILEDVEK